ncbi:MAG TPA: hypothetical protein VIS77_13380 [Burkholderiales bacterium]
MKLLWCLTLALAGLFSTPAFALGGMVDLAVHDRSDGRALKVYWHAGRAYIAGRPGNDYRIEVRSREAGRVLAVVSVDGVNVVSGETADPSQAGYVLSPHGRLSIQGWRKSLAQTAAFTFTALPDSYAARTGRPDDVGVIGVALFRERVAAPPVDSIARRAPGAAPEARDNAGRGQAEAKASADAASGAREERLGTGHGRREVSHATRVAFERATATPVETITLYYDRHEALVAAGVIREPSCASSCTRCGRPCVSRPRPFPGGFVPDPGA